MSGARGADQRGLPSFDAARQMFVSIVDLPFAIGVAGAGVIGLTVGFQHTEDASALPIRMAGALLTGFVAGLVGRGRQGWISATLGASLALLCFTWLSSEPGVSELLVPLVFVISFLALAPGYGLGHVVARAVRHGLPRAGSPSTLAGQAQPNRLAAPAAAVENKSDPVLAVPPSKRPSDSFPPRGGVPGWPRPADSGATRAHRASRSRLTGARFSAVMMSILGPMVAFGFFYSFAGSDEPEAAIASGVSVFVGSFVAVGLCCAVDGRGIKGALQALVIPVAGVALLVLAALGALTEGGSTYGAAEWLRTIALAFLVVAVPIEFGYLVGRFVAWLRRMRGSPTVTPTSARGPSETVEEKP
jgi:uncharacterized membrane protein